MTLTVTGSTSVTARPSRRCPAPMQPAASRESTSGRSWARRRRWTTQWPCSQVRGCTTCHTVHLKYCIFCRVAWELADFVTQLSFTCACHCALNSSPRRVLSAAENVKFFPEVRILTTGTWLTLSLILEGMLVHFLCFNIKRNHYKTNKVG